METGSGRRSLSEIFKTIFQYLSVGAAFPLLSEVRINGSLQLLSFVRRFRFGYTFYLISYILVSLIYISLSLHFPVFVVTIYAHDDMFYMTKAQSIAAGQWLGPFNQMTLVRGPGYSLFLALNYLLGFPVSLSTALLYLAACTGFVWIARRAGLQKPLAWGLFVCVLFQPWEFPNLILRENIYTPLVLFTISGWAYVTLSEGKGRHKLFVAISGIAAGMYWITREEGVWIMPGLIILGVYGVIVTSRNKTLLSLQLGAALFFGFAALPVLATGLMNYVKYGSFQIVDVKSSAFERALSALNSVTVGDEIQYVPVPFKKREAIYKVSPAFSELQRFFERGNPDNLCKLWLSVLSAYLRGLRWRLVHVCPPRRRGRAWLLQIPADRGRIYYNRLSREVELACADRRLSCSNPLLPFVPKIPAEAYRTMPMVFLRAIEMSTYQLFVPDAPPDNRSPQWARLVEFLGNPRVTPSAYPRARLSAGGSTAR